MQSPLSQLVFGALGAAAMTLLNLNLGKFVRWPGPSTPGGHLISLAYLAPLLFFLLLLARGAARLARSTAFLVTLGIALAAPMGLIFLLQQWKVSAPPWLGFSANNIFGPIGMVLLGAGIGRLLKHSNTLLAAAGFGLFFDIVVVTLGPVAHLLETNSKLIAAVSVGAGAPRAVPLATNVIPLLSSVTIGPADVLFLAMFLSSVARLETKEPGALSGGAHPGSLKKTFWWMYGFLLAALALVEFTALPVPALVPMGIAVLVANVKNAAFTPREKRDLIIGAFFAAACAALIVFLAGRIKTAPPDYGLRIGRAMSGGRPFILVSEVTPGSPAERAGIRPGDLILAVNEKRAPSLRDDELLRVLGEATETGVKLLVAHPGERPRPLRLVRQGAP